MSQSVLKEIAAELAEPTSRGLADAVGRAVSSGALHPGDRLPPIRDVAQELKVSPTTVSAAWAALRRAGAIRTDGRRGTFIAGSQPGQGRYRRAVSGSSRFGLDLSTGVPDPQLLPDLTPVLRNINGIGGPHSYLDDPVLPALMDQIRLTWPCDAQGLTLADGATDALSLIIAEFIGIGTRVAVENPTFAPILDLLDTAGAEAIPVECDSQGMIAVSLQAALDQGVSTVVLQPRGNNPTGVSLTPARARQLVTVLRGARCLVVEDDSLEGIASTAPISLSRWLPEQVLHIRSFSKAYGPDLRLAAIGGQAEWIERIEQRRHLGQGWSSRLLQQVLLGLLTSAQAQHQVAQARQEYARRRKALVDVLARHEVLVGGDDGINIWVPVADETAALQNLAAAGIGAAPGAPFHVSPGEPHVRVTVGLLADDAEQIGAALADAARSGGLVGR